MKYILRVSSIRVVPDERNAPIVDYDYTEQDGEDVVDTFSVKLPNDSDASFEIYDENDHLIEQYNVKAFPK